MQELNKVELQQGHSAMVEIAEKAIMKSQGDIDMANVNLSKLSHAIKQLEDKRLLMTKPINQGLTEINNTFKGIKLPLRSAYSILDGKVMTWRRDEQAKREKESARLMEETRLKNEKIEAEENRRKKIRDAHEAKGHNVSDEPIEIEREIAPVVPDLAHTDSTKIRKEWTWEVVDETKIPRKFFVLNEVMINKEVRTKLVREISGLRIFQKDVRLNQKVF